MTCSTNEKWNIERYGQILAAVIMGACSIYAAYILSSGVEKGVDKALEGNEAIRVEVQGFNSNNTTDRVAMAHNFSGKAGMLLKDAVIVVRDAEGNELQRIQQSLNPGLATPEEPFKLLGDSGWDYFLGARVQLPDGAKRCVLEYKVWRSADETRTGQTPPFDCHNE